MMMMMMMMMMTIVRFRQNFITTLAGTNSVGYSGDGGEATSAQLNFPVGVSVDINGNLFIADQVNSRIRMVNSAGIISTYAGGTGSWGYGGDGGLATIAQLNQPTGVSADINGNVYIADLVNHRIRMVNSAGIISTFAGTGEGGYNGDGSATSAQLNYPYGLSADVNGNVYIADKGNHRIRMVNSAGIITTYAGTGTAGYFGDGDVATSAQLNNPWAVSADINGNVYIADRDNQRIRMVNSAGIITTFAGTGTAGFGGDGSLATIAQLNYPHGVSTDINRNVYIPDQGNNRIRMVNSAGIITTYAGTGTAGYFGDGGAGTSAQLNDPSGVAVDLSGNVYIADTYNNRIRYVAIPSQPVSHPKMLPSCQPSSQPSGNDSPYFIRYNPK